MICNLTNLINFSSRYRIPLIGVASNEKSLLLKSSHIKILLPRVRESDKIGIVPTSSFSLTILAMDCLGICLMQKSNFSAAKFKKFHTDSLKEQSDNPDSRKKFKFKKKFKNRKRPRNFSFKKFKKN